MNELLNQITTLLAHLWELAEWLFVTIFIKYIFVRYLAEKVKDYLTKTRDGAIKWDHYRLRARGHGHDYTTVEECPEGACRFIKTTPVAPVQSTSLLS
jgi:hypothetical protein